LTPSNVASGPQHGVDARLLVPLAEVSPRSSRATIRKRHCSCHGSTQ
jgi:hypothetical protein